MLSSDSELLRLIAHRDQDALSELYQRYCNLVYSLAFHTLQNTDLAEEVTQDVFIKIWIRPNQWNPAQGKFSSWLLTVTRYTAIDRLRKEQRQPASSLMPPEAVPDGPPRDPSQPDGDEIRRWIGQLPPEQAQAIEFAFFRGMTHTEI